MTEDYIKYLGIDWGDARIGLALGDSETKMASPFKVVANLSEVLEVIKEEEIDKIILGKPVKMSGDEVKLTPAFLEFKDKIIQETKVEVELLDERLSSKAADALVGDKKTKASRDALAAMLILQDYLDRL